MKFTHRILSVLIVLLILLNSGMAFAAINSESYYAGYDAGYDYGYEQAGRKTSASNAYGRFKDSREHLDIISEIEKYVERDFRQGFIEGFSEGYEEETNKEQNIDYAKTLGTSLGEIYGARDYHAGKKSNSKDALPGRNSVISMFKLDKQSSAYVNVFIKDFNIAFEEGYNEAYYIAMFEPAKVTLEQGLKDGEEIGGIIGAAYGARDFFEGRDSYFQRDLPTKQEIRAEYFLNNDNIKYEDGFISSFLSAYELAYNEAYRAANMDNATKKATSEIIPISGGVAVTADSRFTMDVPSGTYYHDVNLNIITTYDVGIGYYSNKIKASDSYTIELSNSSGNMDEGKSIKLSFEYYGDKFKGGIYRKDGSNWLYIPTLAEDGKLTAKINPKILNPQGTTFSVFVDNAKIALTDVRGHWANDEIDAYVRRGIISGYSDKTFKPENSISRAEFLALLSRVYNWNTSWYSGNTTAFKDANTFGYYENIINYATSNNFIFGYGDGTFKPSNPISYAEVEIIMKRILPYSSFRWGSVANNMLYDKKTRSNSFNNINNKITRAEVVYMLYNITE